MTNNPWADPEPRRALRDDSEPSGETDEPRRVADQRPHRSRSFLRASGWTVAATLIPGVGLWRTGKRRLGLATIVLTLALVLVAAVVGFQFRDQTLTQASSLITSQAFLVGVGVVLGVIGLLWVAVIGYTHLRVRPENPTFRQRLAGSLLVGGLAFLVAAPMAVAVRYTYDTASLLGSVFGSGNSQTRPTITPGAADPWKGRLNVLVLGGDNGFGRDETLGARTDTVILASVNTKTGDTVLFSLPRNTARMPFPPDSPLHTFYPNGFYDGYDGDNPEFFLNAMYDNVPATTGPDVLGKTDNLGADVLKISVGYALGLPIHYYVMLSLDGFKTLVDALGGITINVNSRIPMGGNTDRGVPPERWLEPGPNQHLDGTEALWYARGRYGTDDFNRMDRQRCVIDAVIRQAAPVTLLTRYQEIVKAGKQIIRTDVPSDALSPLLMLAQHVQEASSIRSIVFKHGVDGFSSPNPNFTLMQARVKAAISAGQGPSQAPSPTASSSSARPTGTPTTRRPTATSSRSTPSAENLKDACAYNPQ